MSLLFKLRSALQRLQAGSLVLMVRRLPGVGEMGDVDVEGLAWGYLLFLYG